jgi:hypothetical protein
MRIPQDIANLLAVVIRDVIWFKVSVRGFLKECGVAAHILAELPESTPTIKLIHHVLDRLDSLGADGERTVRQMLTRMYYWKDFHTVPPDRKDRAASSLKELQKAYQNYESQAKFQEETEKKTHEERVMRTQIQPLDHARLQGFRDEFDSIHAESNPQTRGNSFEALMNKIFHYYSEKSKGSFRRTGEQLDGQFYFDKHWYYVEVRWKEDKANAADISVLRDRAKNAFGGDTKALFISFNGFTSECLESLRGKSDERVILMDGFDLRCVLDCQIAFDILLAEKQGEMVQNGRSFVSAKAILERRL